MANSSSPMDSDVPGMAAHSIAADIRLLAQIRLVLAASALLIAVVDQSARGHAHINELLVLSCYLAVCAAAYARAGCARCWTQGKLMHRIDAVACAAMAATGADAGIFPLVFLLFAIVVASLRFGLEEGARTTFLAVTLHCAAVIGTHVGAAPARLFLQAAVLLAFGRAIARLGERQHVAARRQALLVDLNQVANPLFGIDRTMTAALDRLRAYFVADHCIVLLEARDSGAYAIRAVHADGPPVAPAETVEAVLARALLPDPPTQVLCYVRARHGFGGLSLGHGGAGRWAQQDERRLGEVADLLEAGSFISAPVAFGLSRGRIYVAARSRHLGRGDALFLARIAARELAAIDRIELLDCIASDAALRERKKIALDLHDTAIQSYVGLQFALTAVRRKISPSNEVSGELEKLAGMAEDAILDLREYAQRARGGTAADEPICLASLRRQAAQALATYGVDVHIEIAGTIAFGDRLSAEVLQIVREGISNVCRHTDAKRAGVLLRCGGGTLRIEINNEHGAKQPPPFQPRSICERARALGGSAFVREGRFNDTIVCVEIPL